MSKICTKCCIPKDDSEYYKNGKDGYHTYCKDCHRLDRILYKYNVTAEAYAEMHEIQDNKCAICLSSDPGGRSAVKNFMIDHDHNTGKVRGLLCHSCNILLGHSKDNSSRLRQAADYIDSHDQYT